MSFRRQFSPVTVLSVVLFLGVAASGRCAEPAPLCPGCNVVLISIDTLRADHLPCYGYHRDTAPFLCELAERGLFFENCANTGGATLPVHMSMMTSLYPSVHGMTSPTEKRRLDEHRVTLAEQLATAGYRRVAFTDGGLTSASFGFDQGFSTYDDSGRGLEGTLPKAIDWLNGSSRDPFFMFIHTYDVHSERSGAMLPYSPPQRYRNLFGPESDFCTRQICGTTLLRRFNEKVKAEGIDGSKMVPEEHLQRIIGLYDGGIRSVDDMLRVFVGQIERRGLLDRTIIVITSDHGEEFLEHGRFLHTATQYEELTHVPLIIMLPGVAARRIEHLVSTIDIMPTVLELVGVEITDEAQGRSVMPAVLADRAIRDEVFLGCSIRNRKWKLFPGRDELYDCLSDAGNQTNVAAQHPEICAALGAKFAATDRANLALRNSLRMSSEKSSSEVHDGAMIDELRALGYVD